jgi:hypothetical protein
VIRLSKKKVAYFLCSLFLVHWAFNLERILLVNEIFVFCGFVILLQKFSCKIRLYKHDIPLILYIVYTSITLIRIFFMNNVGTSYQIFRTLPFYYSIFAFFLGIWLAKYIVHYNNIFVNYLKYIVVFFGPVITLVTYVFFSIRNNKTKLIATTILVTTLLFNHFYIQDGNLTLYILSTIALFSIIFNTTQLVLLQTLFRPAVFISLFTGTIVSMTWIYFTYNSMFINFSPSLLGDSNVVWRITFWFNSLENLIHSNLLFGIGLGTPIVSPDDARFEYIRNVNPNDSNIFYTISLHNSQLTLLVRFGIIGLLLYVWALYSIISKAVSKCNNDKYLWYLLTSFILLNISALFNVVLESPLYASTYWMLLGLISFRIR